MDMEVEGPRLFYGDGSVRKKTILHDESEREDIYFLR